MLLTPGAVPYADWRAIYHGATPSLNPACRPLIAESAAAVARILARGEPVYGINTGFGKLASVRIDGCDLAALQRNIVLSHAAGVGDPMPIPIARLMMALKLASLARGASGVAPATVALLETMLARDLIPVVPAKGSVGASGDLAPLAHMTATMIGVGEIFVHGVPVPADRALAEAGLAPLELGPKEGLALLNGTQFSTAYALAALFEAERLYRAALVTGVLSTEAAKGSDTPFDHRIHTLRGHSGQIETADALRDLMAGSAIRASHRADDLRVQDPYCLRCQPQVMGAVLTLLRQAGEADPTAAPVRLIVSGALASNRETVAGPLAGSIGRPAFKIDIGKSRTALPGQFTLEWNPNEHAFAERTENSGAVVPASQRGADPAPASGAVLAFPALAAPAPISPTAGHQPSRQQHPAHRSPRRAG